MLDTLPKPSVATATEYLPGESFPGLEVAHYIRLLGDAKADDLENLEADIRFFERTGLVSRRIVRFLNESDNTPSIQLAA